MTRLTKLKLLAAKLGRALAVEPHADPMFGDLGPVLGRKAPSKKV